MSDAASVIVDFPTFPGTDSLLRGDLAASTGSALISDQLPYTGAQKRTVAARARDQAASLREFGGIGDDSTDNSTAIQNWLNVGAQGIPLSAPQGIFRFSTPISHASPSGLVIQGAGPFSTVFKYVGASTTADLFSLGTVYPASPNRNMTLRDFRIASDTTMTAGAGLHLKNVVRSDLSGVIPDGQDGNGKLFNGIWFDQVDCVTYTDFIASASNDCLRVNGGVGLSAKADLFLDNAKICPSDGKTSACGIHIGGAFGGLQLGALDVIGCATNMIVDTALAAESNREVTISELTAFDTSQVGPCVLLNDGGTGTLYFGASGTWFGSAKTHGIQINNTSCNYNIVIDGGRIYNNILDGILNNSPLAQITVSGSEIRANGSVGVDNAGNGSVRLSNPRFVANGANTSGPVDVDGVPQIVVVPNGSNAVINLATGIVGVCMANGGNSVAMYACAAGVVVLMNTTNAAKWVASTTTPAAGAASVAYNGSAYAVYNNTGASITVNYSPIVLNTGH